MAPQEEKTQPVVIGDESDDYHGNDGDEAQTSVFINEASPQEQVMDRSEKTEQQQAEEEQEQRAVMMGAGLLTGLLGCLFCGPVAGCAMGAGAAVGAARPTHAGNVARSLGHCALSCARRGQHKVATMDEHHQVSTRVQESTVFQKSRAVLVATADHPVTVKTQSAAASGWQRVRNVNARFRLTSRSWEGVHSALDVVHGVVMGEKPGSDGNTVMESSSSSSNSSSFSIVDEDDDDDDEEQEVVPKVEVGRAKNGVGYAAVTQTEVQA